MNIEEQEQLLDSMNQKIIKVEKRISKIPTKRLKYFFYKRLGKYILLRNEVFRNLREETRKVYPERFG